MTYLDTRTGITFGYPDGADNYGASLNATLQRLAYLLVQLVVLRVNINNPPANPSEGDRYIVGDSPTGAWTGYSKGDIAIWGQNVTASNLGWQRFRPYVGMEGHDRGEGQSIAWDGTEWSPTAAADVRNQMNFDPSSISGTGTRTDPWTVIFPEDKDTQADWLSTVPTDPATIKNLPSWLRHLQSTQILPTLSRKQYLNRSGISARGGRITKNRLFGFSPTEEQRRLSFMQFRIGAAFSGIITSGTSITRYRLVVEQGSVNARSRFVSGLHFSTGRGSYTVTGILGVDSSIVNISLEIDAQRNRNIRITGDLYYGLIGNLN